MSQHFFGALALHQTGGPSDEANAVAIRRQVRYGRGRCATRKMKAAEIGCDMQQVCGASHGLGLVFESW